ncbi:MAG: MFS transporter, partial [Opitutales bacterium]|nr:MFS transporter [Opitutales bacterium]
VFLSLSWFGCQPILGQDRNERDYTKALSLSRLAYDLEAFLSPVLAAALLAFMSFHVLFFGTTLGFLASALLIITVALPTIRKKSEEIGFFSRVTFGSKIYLKTPRLRGLLGLCLTVATAGSMVIVNTVVYVREYLSGSDQDVAIMLAAYGIGSMIIALLLPTILDRLRDRSVMMTGAIAAVVMMATASMLPGYATALIIWMGFGAATALILVPSGRLLVRSSQQEDRSALFAAHFALSHACWLITYPLAGWLGAILGLSTAFLAMAGLGIVGLVAALLTWPRNDESILQNDFNGG